MKITFPKAKSLLILSIGIVVFQFIFTKATEASFTHDESFTYLNYPHNSFIEIISFTNWFMNNHILNSLFMKYSEYIFGNSEIALRLPNLLALVVYMLYSYKLLQHKYFILSIAIFVTLCSNILLIDLFGLARGYGLSCGFMMMSLYHFITYLDVPQKKHLYGFHLAALLAVLSHFTLLPFYIALLLIFSLMKFLQTQFNPDITFHLLKSYKPHIIPLILNVIVLYEPVRRAFRYGQLNVGGKSGFYADTVSGFILNISNGIPIPPFILIILQIIFTIVVLIPFLILIRNIVKKEESFFVKYKGLIVTNLLLIIISLVILLNHHILRADFPVGRFSIFLFPIFTIHFGFFIDFLLSSSIRKVALAFTSIIALLGMTSFAFNAQPYSFGEWAYDSETKNMLNDLKSYRKLNNDTSTNVKLGVNWLFEPTINFYRITEKLDWLVELERKDLSEGDDYMYAFENSITPIDSIKYQTIKRYENIQTILIKVKKQNIHP